MIAPYVWLHQGAGDGGRRRSGPFQATTTNDAAGDLLEWSIGELRRIAWLQGIHAAKLGRPKAANPYDRRPRPLLYLAWLAGHRTQVRQERNGTYS